MPAARLKKEHSRSVLTARFKTATGVLTARFKTATGVLTARLIVFFFILFFFYLGSCRINKSVEKNQPRCFFFKTRLLQLLSLFQLLGFSNVQNFLEPQTHNIQISPNTFFFFWLTN
jgi:hypothetical protein